MIDNNQKLQQMAIHKQNNYTSPEVTVVEFKMEKGFGDSMKVGNDSLLKNGTQTFTHDDNSTNDNWSSVIPSSTPISGN
ncbi:MAG: hypothetical protein J6X88_04510 [Bacteroidales bacterium]|nr:hypothetical protein [Bacteroidales bacterium]